MNWLSDRLERFAEENDVPRWFALYMFGTFLYCAGALTWAAVDILAAAL